MKGILSANFQDQISCEASQYIMRLRQKNIVIAYIYIYVILITTTKKSLLQKQKRKNLKNQDLDITSISR